MQQQPIPYQPPAMLLAVLLSASILILGMAVAYQHYRSQMLAQEPEVLFEERINPPFLRPVVTRLTDGELLVEAPVVHARLMQDILVLDVKSNSGSRAEGFEIAITDFDAAWLMGSSYRHHAATGHVLVGPQGEMSDRLLRRTAREHHLDLPDSTGSYVQVFDLTGIITDPNEFSVEARATLPNGDILTVRYDYASATLEACLPASALSLASNYQPLGVQLEAAA